MGLNISIHALREEGDTPTRIPASTHTYFYPRPPRGGRLCFARTRKARNGFLSTPSARRATDFYYPVFANLGISIHALREEGDSAATASALGVSQFLSTPSARRATDNIAVLFEAFRISIHALREEGDISSRPLMIPNNKFLSTPSARRATQGVKDKAAQHEFLSTPSARRATKDANAHNALFEFLSTPSARRATKQYQHNRRLYHISIHALREEGDALHIVNEIVRHYISIHALREEGDSRCRSAPPGRHISIHALREEGDRPPAPP